MSTNVFTRGWEETALVTASTADWIRVVTTRARSAVSVIRPSDAMSSITPATVVARTT